MIDSLLLRTFRQLPAKDLRLLGDFVQSPCFNRREELTRLCEYITRHINKPDRRAYDAEHLFAAAFPNQGYDNKLLRHTMSYLLDVVRQFLAWAEWRTDNAEQQRYLLRALRNRNLEGLAEKTWQAARETAAKQPVRDAHFHFRQYQLHQDQLEQTARHERSARLNLQPLPDELTVFT